MSQPSEKEVGLAILAADLAKLVDEGKALPDTAAKGLHALAMTMDQEARHRAAKAAELRAGALGQLALDLIRVAIFAIA